MPELPEVEVIRRDLEPAVVGHIIESVRLTAPRLTRRVGSPRAVEAALPGRIVRALRRRGKFLLFDLTGGDSLVLRLGMTGQIRWTGPGQTFPADGHTHARIVLSAQKARLTSDGPASGTPSPSSTGLGSAWGSGVLWYRDVRKFGELFVLPTAEVEMRLRIGREPLDPAFGPGDLFRLSRADTRIKTLLLDQRKLAGVGNIYTDEALFRAGIRPTRRARTLTRAQAARLLRALRAVLEAGIRHRGSSISDYRDASGARGRFARLHRVYHRHGQPCPRCGTLIRQIRLAQRSTHFCPRCQH